MSELFRENKPPISGTEVGEVTTVTVAAELPSHTLTDMAVDYTYFYLGVLARFYRLTGRDVIAEACRLVKTTNKGEVFRIDYTEPFVVGAATAELPMLNNQLYAVPHEASELFSNLLTSAAFMDSASGFFARVVGNRFDILDPFEIKKRAVIAVPPLVSVGFLGLSTTAGCSVIVDRYPEKPAYVNTPPQAGIAQVRDAYLFEITNGRHR